MPTKGKSNLYGRGKRGQSNDHISFKYANMYISKGFDIHYQTHGKKEMGLTSDQYRSRAISFSNKVDRDNHVSFVNEKGLTVKYSLITNELAMITKEGHVATYFITSLKQYERVKRDYGR